MSYRDEMIQVAAVAVAAIQNLDTGSTHGGNYLKIGMEILKERDRQESMWGSQNRTPQEWMVILMEEVGEAAKDVLEDNLGG